MGKVAFGHHTKADKWRQQWSCLELDLILEAVEQKKTKRVTNALRKDKQGNNSQEV